MTDQNHSVNYMNTPKFFAHHVGGRGGSVSFPSLTKFSDDITQIIYDADKSCLDQVKERWQGQDVKIFPYCLSDSNGTAKFHINYCPFTSSLYPTNMQFGNYYEDYGRNLEMDYLFEFSLATQRVIKIETFSIDYLVQNNKIPKPDFLSIDTQGAELSILRGATNTLNSSVVAVMCEINFTNLYTGVPLFGELDAFMRSNNFILATINPLEFGYKRIPKAYRGKTMPLQGEALYLLLPDSVAGSEDEMKVRLEKLAFAAITFGFTEFASEAMEKVLRLPETNKKRAKYQDFLFLFQKEISKSTVLPQLWNETVSFEESFKRFEVSSDKQKSLSAKLLADFQVNPKVATARIIKGVFSRTKLLVNRILSLVGLQFTILHRPSHFETFLRQNGFEQAAVEVHKRRYGQ